MRSLYPFKLKGVTKSPIWGGTRLLQNWNKTSDCDTVGESWELTVRAGDVCTVVNGAYAGKTLSELIASDRDAIMGTSSMPSGAFPLLVKLIDATDRLSVQVHPDDAYAARVENDRGKTEMWYIVEADEGAEIVCGLLDGVSAADYARAVQNGDFESLLKHQPVHAGQTYFIPSGLPHAIGKGILIAEIQQNCDLTYRVYDYNRRDKNGNTRELHVGKALDVIRPFSHEEIEQIRYARLDGRAPTDGLLADCDYFRVEKITLDGSQVLAPCARMRHLLCLDGDVTLTHDGAVEQVRKGDSILLPAALSDVTLDGAGSLLLSEGY
ncbi:MAG: class I mannose-6-phosphate isomerase [Clostridia bacterium]|nr:class I mannose-6-phosphate isomerase [Clostridia bacterium]